MNLASLFPAIGGFIVNLLGGGLFKQAVNGLLTAQQQQLAADTDEKRILAEQNVAFWERQVEFARDAMGQGTERQRIKMNQPVFWGLLGAALLPGLGTFVLIAIYNVLWHKAGIWPQPWNIAAFPPPYDQWAQMSIEWVFDPIKLAATTGVAAAGGWITGKRP